MTPAALLYLMLAPAPPQKLPVPPPQPAAAAPGLRGTPPAPAARAEKTASRATIVLIEKTLDAQIPALSLQSPYELLGNARGVYLPGYGVVLTTEVNLMIVPGQTPFRPAFTKEEIARIRQQKVERLPRFKQEMTQLLLAAAAKLDTLQPTERVTLAVSLFSLKWEDTAGLPGQLVFSIEKGKLAGPNGAAAVEVREF